MRMSSVAMITESRALARRQASQTCRRRGLPAISCKGFPGKRVEPQRAGIMPAALVIEIHNYLSSGLEIVGNKIGQPRVHPFTVTSPDQNCFHAGVVST